MLSKRCKPPPVEAAAASFANGGYAVGEVRRRRKVSARVGFASEIATFDSTVSSTPCSGTGDPYKVRWGDFITSEEDIPRRIPPFRGKRRLPRCENASSAVLLGRCTWEGRKATADFTNNIMVMAPRTMRYQRPSRTVGERFRTRNSSHCAPKCGNIGDFDERARQHKFTIFHFPSWKSSAVDPRPSSPRKTLSRSDEPPILSKTRPVSSMKIHEPAAAYHKLLKSF